ncbi:DUF6266 family protein [Pedobacter frigoris]|uniref:DUF6266 family protein n=1 Tax=Pedobacter frigoris TaxID=2571272 RepID=UPI00292F5B38|nr:DUF6266 family protein [Pedobacter frigoris]
MARYKNGINGPLSGKVGHVVAVNWRGIDYLRSLPEQSEKAPSQAQLYHWKAFGMVSAWLKPLKALIWIGFQIYKAGKTPMNEAISFIFKNALIGEGAEKQIDFSKAIFSRGELFISMIKEILSLIDAILHIKWENAAESVFNQHTDLVTFIWYCPQNEKFVTFKDAAQRGDQEAILQLPAGFEGQELHGYMQCVNDAGNLVSTTLYLGVTIVT